MTERRKEKKKSMFQKKLLKWFPSIRALYARAASLAETEEHLLNKNEQINECNPVSRQDTQPYLKHSHQTKPIPQKTVQISKNRQTCLVISA